MTRTDLVDNDAEVVAGSHKKPAGLWGLVMERGEVCGLSWERRRNAARQRK